MALSNIGAIAVNLIAKTQKFDKGIDKSRKKVGRFSKSAKSAGKSIKMLGAAALGAVGVGGLGIFLRSQLDTLDALGKTADKLGVSTEKLAVYQHAAKLSGLETNQLDNSIQRMQRNIGEAARGVGEAKRELAALGLDAKELQRIGPEKSFELIAQKINKMGTQAEKLSFVNKIFGREGAGLVNLFAQDLGKVEEKFNALGGGPSREGVAQVEKFNDAMTDLKAAIGVIGQKFVIAIAPEATEFVDKLTAWTADVKNSTIGKIFEGISKEFTAQDGMFKFKERRNPFTGKMNKTTGSLILDTLFHDSGMRNVERHFDSKHKFKPAAGQRDLQEMNTLARSIESFAKELVGLDVLSSNKPEITLEPSVVR